MTNHNVAVVGGGVAGLCAARLLQAANVSFVLVEARDRLGGRVLTVDGFDLGPSWYWPQMQPALGKLVDELRLSAFAQRNDGDAVIERMPREAAQRYRGPAPDHPSMRLAGGTAALVQALAHEVPSDKLVLGARVTAMALTATGVTLTIAHVDGAMEALAATRVIAAVPPRLLEATVAFTPELQATTAQRWRDTPTWMAPHAKFFARYERPFWRDANLSGTAQSMVGPMVEMHDATTASGSAGVFGFIGIAADQRTALGEAALTRACIEQLARIFGAKAREPSATLIKDWAADPLTATAADRAASGHPVPAGGTWVHGAWGERLVLAGSETSASEPGYLAGAVAAAERAVAETLRRS